jgi:hypothetical protein
VRGIGDQEIRDAEGDCTIPVFTLCNRRERRRDRGQAASIVKIRRIIKSQYPEDLHSLFYAALVSVPYIHGAEPIQRKSSGGGVEASLFEIFV